MSKSKQFCNPLIESQSKQFCNPLMADGNKRSYVLKQNLQLNAAGFFKYA